MIPDGTEAARQKTFKGGGPCDGCPVDREAWSYLTHAFEQRCGRFALYHRQDSDFVFVGVFIVSAFNADESVRIVRNADAWNAAIDREIKLFGMDDDADGGDS